MAGAQYQEISEQNLALSGDLDRDTVPGIWQSLSRWTPGNREVEVDLSALSRVDSAGLAMLIHLIGHAKKQNCHIMLSFVPEQLRTLCRLSNAEVFLSEHIKNQQG